MLTSLLNVDHDLDTQTTTVHFRTTPELVKFLDTALVAHDPVLLVGTIQTQEQIAFARTFLVNHTSPNPQSYITLVGIMSDLLSVDSPTNSCINCLAQHCEDSDLCEGCALELANGYPSP